MCWICIWMPPSHWLLSAVWPTVTRPCTRRVLDVRHRLRCPRTIHLLARQVLLPRAPLQPPQWGTPCKSFCSVFLLLSHTKQRSGERLGAVSKPVRNRCSVPSWSQVSEIQSCFQVWTVRDSLTAHSRARTQNKLNQGCQLLPLPYLVKWALEWLWERPEGIEGDWPNICKWEGKISAVNACLWTEILHYRHKETRVYWTEIGYNDSFVLQPRVIFILVFKEVRK